jgi:mRNA-degrading endonuclease RelE of RelBE toxin-antitoxin system
VGVWIGFEGLLVTNQFRHDFRKLEHGAQEVVHRAVELLRTDPAHPTLNIKKLKGHMQPTLFRVRIGVYRVVFAHTGTTLTLYRACHRRDVYKRL